MFGYTKTEMNAIYILMVCATILAKVLFTYITYHFLVWLEAPQWIVIAITASAWIGTKFTMK